MRSTKARSAWEFDEMSLIRLTEVVPRLPEVVERKSPKYKVPRPKSGRGSIATGFTMICEKFGYRELPGVTGSYRFPNMELAPIVAHFLGHFVDLAISG